MKSAAPRKADTRARAIADDLRRAILSGDFAPGDKLPSEAQLTETHGVSRTVVREAIATLRLDGLVEAHQGAGVFVLDLARRRSTETAWLASTLELLEFRTPLEVAAAGLAAVRRSPVQEERILDRHAALCQHVDAGGDAFRDDDYRLHYAIAEATNNGQFTDFMRRVGEALVPPSSFIPHSDEETRRDYRILLIKEHEAIVRAISASDKDAAEEAMMAHLIGSQDRHRALLHSQRLGQVAVPTPAAS
ncbi:FadR/GntR family transcriptional regulator [Pelagovum pacificum]|uniref:FadR family transcriptional regulator n=1 Tax=Pelagovum pacificum TaxID=2588711 RepID=A0A5C5GFE5_9RHOB|nr:FadR/GntR family transcriptional regulator [Pelagovum pacificum]QQA43380.1 FadR family transcriptional regulator [Pelagovum pacificum]TNY33482.1 FadR family transcriptional regulator [Pelagovum pacificum]